MLRDLVEFAYLTGARQGEILKLQQRDVDLNKRVCTFIKLKMERTEQYHYQMALLIFLKI